MQTDSAPKLQEISARASSERQQPPGEINVREKKTRKKPSKMGILPSSITQEDLAMCFHLPSEEACLKLGISLTVLKRVCRKYGIKRWPFRKMKSLSRLLTNLGSTMPTAALPELGPLSGASTPVEASASTNDDTTPASSMAGKQQGQQSVQQRQLTTGQQGGQPPMHRRHQQQGAPSGELNSVAAGATEAPAAQAHPHSPTVAGPPPSERCSFATSAIDMLIAAMESEPREGTDAATVPASAALGTSIVGSAVAASTLTLQAPLPQAPGTVQLATPMAEGGGEGREELEEGEIPSSAGQQAASEGCGETGCGEKKPAASAESALPPQALARQQQWQWQQQGSRETRESQREQVPAVVAQADALVHPQPIKPVSVKHIILAKYLAQQPPQQTALALEQHGPSQAPHGVCESPHPALAGQLERDGSCELERLPTFSWDARQQRQPTPQSPHHNRQSPGFSFNLGLAGGSAGSAPGTLRGVRVSNLWKGPVPRPVHDKPSEVTVASLHRAASPHTAPAAAQQAAAAAAEAAAASGSNRHAGVRPAGAVKQRSQRKRPAPNSCPLPPSPFKQARLSPAGGGEEATSPYVPVVGVPVAAADPPHNPYSHLVQRLRRAALLQSAASPPARLSLCQGPSAQQQQQQQQQQTQRTQQAGMQWREVLQQQEQRDRPQLQLSPSGSFATSLAASIPQQAQQAQQPQQEQQVVMKAVLSALNGDAADRSASLLAQLPCEDSAAAAALQQRQQLRGALQAAVLAGRSLPPRLALWCLQRYAQRLGYTLHSVNMTSVEEGASAGNDSGIGSGGSHPAPVQEKC